MANKPTPVEWRRMRYLAPNLITATCVVFGLLSIVASSLLTSEQRVLVSGGRDGRYVSSGHIVYYREGSLLAVAFDAATVQVKGETVSIFDGVTGSTGTSGAAHFATSERGGLVSSRVGLVR